VSVTVALADATGDAGLTAVTVTVSDVATLDGAVYRPEEEIAPTEGLIDQVTEVLLFPTTVAVNCWVPDVDRLTVVGLTDTIVV
jgi:hypothetical protein